MRKPFSIATLAYCKEYPSPFKNVLGEDFSYFHCLMVPMDRISQVETAFVDLMDQLKLEQWIYTCTAGNSAPEKIVAHLIDFLVEQDLTIYFCEYSSAHLEENGKVLDEKGYSLPEQNDPERNRIAYFSTLLAHYLEEMPHPYQRELLVLLDETCFPTITEDRLRFPDQKFFQDISLVSSTTSCLYLLIDFYAYILYALRSILDGPYAGTKDQRKLPRFLKAALVAFRFMGGERQAHSISVNKRVEAPDEREG